METTEMFVKVYIKDSSDLPKENGNYFVFRDGIKCIHAFIEKSYQKRYYDDLTYEEYWLKYIEAYLIPIQQLGRDEIIEVLKPFLAFAEERLGNRVSIQPEDDNQIVYGYNRKEIKIGDLRRLKQFASELISVIPVQSSSPVTKEKIAEKKTDRKLVTEADSYAESEDFIEIDIKKRIAMAYFCGAKRNLFPVQGEVVAPSDEEHKMYENMQYYMEYCQKKGYVTPKDWIGKYKHF